MSALNDFLGRNFLNDRGVAFGISLILLDSIKLSRTSSSSLASSSRMSTFSRRWELTKVNVVDDNRGQMSRFSGW